MKRFIINIGSHGGRDNPARRITSYDALNTATHILRLEEPEFAWFTPAGPGEENTFVIRFDCIELEKLTDRLNDLSVALDQDCIAIFDRACDRGALVGPYSHLEPWNTGFNPFYFIP